MTTAAKDCKHLHIEGVPKHPANGANYASSGEMVYRCTDCGEPWYGGTYTTTLATILASYERRDHFVDRICSELSPCDLNSRRAKRHLMIRLAERETGWRLSPPLEPSSQSLFALVRGQLEALSTQVESEFGGAGVDPDPNHAPALAALAELERRHGIKP